MAKRGMKWTVSGSKLTAQHLDEEGVNDFQVDITDLFTDYAEMKPVQQNLIVYGLKQKMADHCAASKEAKWTAKERNTRMTGLFDQLKEGKWSSGAGDVKRGPMISVSKLGEKFMDESINKANLMALAKVGVPGAQEALDARFGIKES